MTTSQYLVGENFFNPLPTGIWTQTIPSGSSIVITSGYLSLQNTTTGIAKLETFNKANFYIVAIVDLNSEIRTLEYHLPLNNGLTYVTEGSNFDVTLAYN